MKITVAVLAGPGGQFEVGEVELDEPREAQVLVKIAATGLCGSDLNVLDGKRSLALFPAVLGHEAAGIVAKVGPGVERLRPGDPVVLSIVPSCRHCPACLRGLPNYCATAGAAMAAGTLMDGTSRLSRGGDRSTIS